MSNTIAFRTFAQKVLFLTEISGQLSDGHWENSRPGHHWEKPCRAEVVVVAAQQGLTFYPSRRYNFGAKDLLDVVSGRMINAVKFFSVYPELLGVVPHHDVSVEDNFVTFAQEVAKNVVRVGDDSTNKYWRESAQGIMKALQVSTDIELNAKLLPVVNFPYSSSDLRKDLKEMSVVFNDTYTRTRPTLRLNQMAA